jgi:release factor glutamine methyltransferase
MPVLTPTTCEEQSSAADLLRRAREKLRLAGRDHAGLLAETLLAHTLGCPRLEWPLHAAEPLSPAQFRVFEEGVGRVAAGEPVQYVTGETGFMGLDLKTDARALIPRPETEGLVAEVLACEAAWRPARPTVLDVGTGSGCVALALARARPQARCVGLDISEAALALAQENACRLGLETRVRFQQANLLAHTAAASAELVVSNPPYVAQHAYARLPLEVRGFEPRCALDGGADGLRVIAPLVEQAARVLKPGGWLFLEMGETQGPEVVRLMTRHGFRSLATSRDLAGRERMVRGRRP